MQVRFPELTLPAFQDGLRRLHDARAIRLLTADGNAMIEPEYAFVVGTEMVWSVHR